MYGYTFLSTFIWYSSARSSCWCILDQYDGRSESSNVYDQTEYGNCLTNTGRQ